MSRLGTLLTSGAQLGPEYRDTAFHFLGLKVVYVKFGLPDEPLVLTTTIYTTKLIWELKKLCRD